MGGLDLKGCAARSMVMHTSNYMLLVMVGVSSDLKATVENLG
jgi:hypothetical protein